MIIRGNYGKIEMKKYAFTLAEILITLAIIGVVAAITIPGMVVKYQKDQTVAQLKKTYTTLAQAVRLSEAENGPNKDWDWGENGNVSSIANSFNTYWKPYLKVLKECSTYSDCGYSSNTPWKYLKNTNFTMNCVQKSSRTSFILQDGIFIIIRSWDGSSSLVKDIYMDLNGPKEPNQFGKDLFMFVLEDQKGLVPDGYTTNVNTNCSKTGYGSFCAAKIIKDGWQMADDYPW